MLKFQITATGVDLEYEGDQRVNNEWLRDELTKNTVACVSRVFSFELMDLLDPPTPKQDFNNYLYRFRFGTFVDN